MPGLRIRKGDEVQVIAGKEIGARGRVLEVLPKKSKVIVEGVARATRHEKIRPAQGRAGQEGGITHKEAAIDVSNVALVCPTDGPTRVGYKLDGDVKVRVCKKCGTEL
jgi:large subunit ribosomal protein L24